MLATVLPLVLLVPFCGKAQAAVSEDKVKAAFILNFVKFVTWPDQPNNNHILIGYFGDEPALSGDLKLLNGREAQGSQLHVLRCPKDAEASVCRVLFIPGNEAGRVPGILREVVGLPILTISDAPGFIHQGGMIGLLLDNKRIRFEVNLAAVLKAGLKMSSKILGLAREVVR